MSSLKPVVAAAVAAVLLASAADAALVVRSVGNGAAAFPVGRTVMPGTAIQLTAGDMLTVLDGQATRTFRGPGTFDLGRAAAATTTLAAATAALDARTAERKPRLGTVRGIRVVNSASIWDVDLDAAASTPAQCVVDPSNVILRRADASGARTLSIAPAGKPGAATTVSFAQGSASAVWPKAIPASGSYTLVDGANRRTLTFTKVAAPTGDATTDASALIKAGCTRQLEKMLATLEKPAD
ncbi:hypothetical protein FHS79_000872 [Polymorphobacter multimanifer]|uniref:Uncharacterized protein n=1 Tax=Polymorphobacter multimanifer TaxID=1070431 RepID=A0A841L292_9SPHN|nr:hypothetical protein [Polymorphobacter multimanifer]MBB6226714.1 hypothetical protein [Polymorphobacter multimanifer]